MENSELIRRAEDLRSRCERKCVLTCTNFLTPTERMQIKQWADRTPDCRVVFYGGNEACERTIAFFLPEYMDPEDIELPEYISAIQLTAHFGQPAHRDYMGAILGMGIGREWIGDILVHENGAVLFCTPGIRTHLLGIEKVGRIGVTAKEINLTDVVMPERRTKNVSFSVMSMRLDAVTAGMFNVSRTEAARQITAGNLMINYLPVEKQDCPVRPGDVLSLRGYGKGRITDTGGTSRKGRLFVNAEIYL